MNFSSLKFLNTSNLTQSLSAKLLSRSLKGIVILSSLSLSACSLKLPPAISQLSSKLISQESPKFMFSKNGEKFSSTGTIIISQQVPSRMSPVELAKVQNVDQKMAPLIGYFPPAGSYSPAENESWLEIIKDSRKVTLYRGGSPVQQISAEGEIKLNSGEFFLQHKQSEPLWYAPDMYFQKRKLATPKPGDRLRYRRGALGKLAIYPTTTFPIHCGPVWNDDVGGIRLAHEDLASIYKALPIGAAIIVK